MQVDMVLKKELGPLTLLMLVPLTGKGDCHTRPSLSIGDLKAQYHFLQKGHIYFNKDPRVPLPMAKHFNTPDSGGHSCSYHCY